MDANERLADAMGYHGGDRSVLIAGAEAIGYAWGRQDESGVRDSGDAFEFGRAWTAVVALYASEYTAGHQSIQGAYLEWKATGTIAVTLTTRETRGAYAVFCPDSISAPKIAPIPWADVHVAYYWREPAARPVLSLVV